MSAIIVGGLSIPVSPGSISRPRFDMADRARALDGTYKASVTGNPKRDFLFTTIPLKREIADVYEGCLAVVTPQVCSGDIIGGSQNIILWSEAADNAAWTKSATTIGADVFNAPNGGLTADKIREDNTNAQHAITQSTTNANGVYTFSAFLFPSERTKAVLSMSDGAGGFASFGFDLATGTTFASGLAVGSWAGISATMTPWPGGWYRCAVTATRGAGTVTIGQIFLWTTVISYTGTTGNGLDVWGMQLQPGPLTSYVKTTTAAVASTLSVNCCAEITGWTPISRGTAGHLVALQFVLHEV